MNAEELFDFIDGLEEAREAGSKGNGIARSRLLAGVEYAQAPPAGERKLRSAWKKRAGGGATPLVLVADDPDGESRLAVLGPQGDGPLRVVRAESLRDLIGRTAAMGSLEAVRHVAEELDRLDTERIAGLTVRGLGTEHLYSTRLPRGERWAELTDLAPPEAKTDWRDVLAALGYKLKRLPHRGHLATHDGKPIAVIHPKRSATEFARLDEEGRLPEGALLADCDANGAPFGLIVAGSRMRLLRAAGEEAGQATRFLELDAGLLEPARPPAARPARPAATSPRASSPSCSARRATTVPSCALRLDRALRAGRPPGPRARARPLGEGRWPRPRRR